MLGGNAVVFEGADDGTGRFLGDVVGVVVLHVFHVDEACVLNRHTFFLDRHEKTRYFVGTKTPSLFEWGK